MKLGALFVTVAVLLATIDAEWVETWIGHDEITPWYQEVPDSISEKAAVRFKPRLRIASGCDPYPAVNSLGQTGGGLKPTGNPRGKCRGNGAGAQVYGHSRWHYDRWAIMYSWYFPKDSPSPGLGHRHDWEHAIVWIDNPEVENPKIIGAATSSHNGYEKYSSVPASCLEGDALKDQMTDEARQALNTVSFGKANCPFNDGNFGGKLDKAWPY
ncbi:hypothetical protein BBP00_00010004 [Phytophthora kernoviae]|uniref:Necrosis inducing-like protein NPP1 type n=2 Tax=Phytophthora kernoviae TaxID=325452 RepID=A0A3F2RAW9_9STRA|nr:hypothetical protein BBP00_00010004 [Phytophthora kernoviae]